MRRKLDYDSSSDEYIPPKHSGTKKEEEHLDYEPVHFLRCHSRKNDAADVQTQVWQCAFEPHTKSSKKNTDIVATCGGNSVCFIDVKTGCVKSKYYSEDISEMFYALSWASLQLNWMGAERENILAVGGSKSTIHLIHPESSVVFFIKKLKLKCKTIINSLLFHPKKPNILFCACSNGEITMWDIGTPVPPNFTTNLTLLHVLHARSEIFTLTYADEADVLLAAYNEGLCGWKITSKEMEIDSKSPHCLEFVMPKQLDEGAFKTGSKVVDSVEVIGTDIVAAKCALHGFIYLWSMKEMLNNKVKGARNAYQVSPLLLLKWSDTDNFFMNMGYNKGAGLLVCGDDKGTLWVYDLKGILQPILPDSGTLTVLPTIKLEWPEVEDKHVVRKRKLSLDVYDIVVDKVAVDCDGKFLVAVTSNNLVCIWRRTS